MITKKQQTTYSEKYRMIKKRYKNGLTKIHNLANHLDVEKKHVLPGGCCKPYVSTTIVWINCIFSNNHFTII